MKVLDLHGLRHYTAEIKVTNFILLNETPLKIITGRSETMIRIVVDICEQHDYEYYPEFYQNYGAYIIRDKTK